MSIPEAKAAMQIASEVDEENFQAEAAIQNDHVKEVLTSALKLIQEIKIKQNW